MTREWIALERHEGRGHDLSLYARALHAQLHRWVDGAGRIDARLDGDPCEAMAASLAFRFGATRGDRRLIAGHLRELVGVGAVVLSADGLELRALADGADLVRHKLAVGDRPQPTKRLKVMKRDEAATIGHEASRTSNEASRTETKDDASARNNSVLSSRIEESRREEKRVEEEGERVRLAHAPASSQTASGQSQSPEVDALAAMAIAAAPAGHQSSLFASTDERPSESAGSTGGASAKTAPRRERRPKPAPAADPLPAEGTVARRVYDAITTDAALAPITRGPGDLAQRLAALCDGVPVDPVACVIEAGAWLRRGGAWRDGAAGLLRWVKRDADRARALPAPVVGAIRAPADAGRIDYQGRRVVGAAGLPPGSAWEKSKEQHEAEEDELYRRAYEATQPKKGATGR